MSSADHDVRGEKSGSNDEQEMYPWWKAAIIALPQLGVQVMWMFLGPNTTPYLVHLGASEAQAAFNNSAGPIVGFFVGPLVGTWSDQSTSKWGRRRPIIVAGLISTVVAGLLYGGAERIMGKEGKGKMYLAAVMQWVLDFTVNAMQTPFRALVSDLVAPKQQRPMQIFFSVVCAVGGFLAFSIMKLYDNNTNHMFELMGFVLIINVVCVSAALSVATEKQYVRTGEVSSSACGPFVGMAAGFKGMPKAFYLLLLISCWVWFGNTVFGVYGKEWFTRIVYPGDPKEGTVGYDFYVEGADAFSSAGQIGSIFQLPLALAFMGLSLTKIPSHLIYAPCILVGGVVCFCCAFVVGHQHALATICFVLSNVPLTAVGSIPYAIVAVWSNAAVQAGNVGSVAMQMAILNCCITVGQEACHLLLGGLESAQPLHEAVKNLFIISAAANGVAGICAFFLRCGQRAPETEKSTMEDDSMESEDVSANVSA